MDYLIHILILFAIYAILAIGLNLVMGYAGLISVAHASFFAVGAYATAILTVYNGWNFFLAVSVGILLSALLSLILAKILSSLLWDYYVLGTVSFAYILHVVALNWQSLTNGPMGITGIPRPSLGPIRFQDNEMFLILALAFLAAAYILARYLVGISFGRVLKAIREDEAAIRVFGYQTTRYKMAIFMIGGMMAALAGSLYAVYIRFLDPSSAAVMESIFILSIVILGGLANLKGSILGALVLVLFPELMRFIGLPESTAAELRQLFYGLLLIVLMRWRPQGLMGEYRL